MTEQITQEPAVPPAAVTEAEGSAPTVPTAAPTLTAEAGGIEPAVPAPKKPIYKKWWFWLIVVFLVAGISGALDGESPSAPAPNSETPVVTEPADAAAEPAVEPAAPAAEPVAEPEPAPVAEPEEPAEPAEPEMTLGQQQALSTAFDYLAYTAFSRTGLIEQLMYEDFSKADATFAADNVGANWKEQAAITAQDYMDYSSFSRTGLIEQLMYEGYTKSQAEYGVKAVGY